MDDPFSTSAPTPRSLGVNYLSGSGDMMAYGGIVVAALGVLAFFVQGQMVFLIMVPIGLAVSAYFYPLIEKGVVRLGADVRGLYFERLGIIPWAAIKSVRHQQKALRTLRLHILHVELRAAPETVVTERDDVPFWKMFMAKAWKRDGNTISIDLHPLAKDPVNLVDHLLAFRPDLLKEVQDVRVELG
ncbi:MAG: hypothetical protein JJ908_16485 [Rhizobiales bacterium]|nr:hypothetical protein [Hyphomicrobiales bacterium]MBO6700431.1 hypothetical protein [Hyphomicrobiales bacterium]MBO6737967.1 hypothetical protein [Hyphomicrobiales bacterium]MBO6913726.1 hypothetical protein [Hyphomicrobiales bacterium]MBO6954379.1 hypothetical protein [Hyphomicrobiales bacterium]